MAHRTTHRRNLAAQEPEISIDSKHKRQPKTTLFTAVTTTVTTSTKPHHHHPTDPDPTIASSTIHNISKHFSKLYSKLPNPPSKPRIDTNLQAKAMATSAIEDDSGKSIAKSNHRRRRTVAEMEKDRLRAAVTGVTENIYWKESHDGHDSKADKFKKLSKKRSAKKESHEGGDTKIASGSLPRSQESGLKEDHEGNDMKRPSISLAVSGGRRKSFCSSQTEMANFFCCNGVKVVAADMPPFMQVHAVDCARKVHDSLENFTSRTLASTLKKEFDGVYGPAWHCIVGTNFGSFVTHSVGGFLYFSMDHKLYILLFKTTVQRAD